MDNLILTVPLGDGSEGWIEVEADLDEQPDGVQLTAGGPGGRARAAAYTLASAMDQVVPAVDKVIERVRQVSRAPDEIALELGLKIGGEHGIILTKGTAEANLKLTVKWFSAARRDADEEPAEG